LGRHDRQNGWFGRDGLFRQRFDWGRLIRGEWLFRRRRRSLLRVGCRDCVRCDGSLIGRGWDEDEFDRIGGGAGRHWVGNLQEQEQQCDGMQGE
jgi:hypothetical protein